MTNLRVKLIDGREVLVSVRQGCLISDVADEVKERSWLPLLRCDLCSRKSTEIIPVGFFDDTATLGWPRRRR